MNRSEEVEQARFVRWSHRKAVRDLMPALRWLHHSPNGGKRDRVVGAQMKALGVKPGFPDLILPAAHGVVRGLALEFKSDVGRPTDSQSEWLLHFASQGYQTDIVRSAERAREIVCGHFCIDPSVAPSLD